MKDTNLIKWEKFRKNALVKRLSKKDMEINLIKLEPNCSFDEHSHEKTEWIFVLEGSYSDADGNYSKGHFLIAKKGSKHTTKSGPQGCQLIVVKKT